MKAENVFQVGQCVKCRVLRSDPSARRLSLSFITTSSRFNFNIWLTPTSLDLPIISSRCIESLSFFLLVILLLQSLAGTEVLS